MNRLALIPTRIEGAKSAADCLYSLDYYPFAPYKLHLRVLLLRLGTKDLARVPRIQVCCRTTLQHYEENSRLDFDWLIEPFRDWLNVNPCGNFSGTSSLKFRGTKGSIGHTFMVCIHTENQNQGDFYPFVLLEISVLDESPLGHLRYCLTDVPPQPNSPPDNVFNPDQPAKDLNAKTWDFHLSSASLNK